MADSFTELREAGGSTRPWTIGALAALAVAVAAALASAGYSLSRPASERSPIPQVVTVTAQPTSPASPAQRDDAPLAPSPGTYTGWALSRSDAGESGWDTVLTLAGDSAMLAYPARGCTLLLTPGTDEQWEAEALAKRCGDTGGGWSLRESAPGVVELEHTGADGATVRASLSRRG